MSSLGYVSLPKPDGATEIVRYDIFVASLFKVMNPNVLNQLHAAVGISGEAGELLDAIKKVWVYNKPLDRENVIEELGDLRFYIQAMMIYASITEQEVLQHNADKLAKRYIGLRYSDQAAQDRADKT
jgi:NTP pyrophosphatase (non-canonical NTP hydrolase)